jgi:branched-chain amino acid transport system permease protein
MLVASAIVSGLGLGSMYGLLALGFYITYSVSSTVNFSQGSSMMLGAVLAYTFAVTLGWPLWAAATLALVLCALYGVLVERVGIRPFAKRGSNAWLMATVALGIVVDNLVLFTFGKEPRGFPMPLATGSMQILGIGVSPLQLVIPVAGLALAGALHAFSRRTRFGKALLAVVQNADASRWRSPPRSPCPPCSPASRASSSRRSLTCIRTWGRCSGSRRSRSRSSAGSRARGG